MTERKKAVFVLIMVAILLLGCSSKQPPRTTLTLNISAGYNINATGSGQAAPLQTRLYELSSQTLFEQADFLDLYLKDASTLQDSLIKKHQLPVLHPGQQRKQRFQLNSATRYVGILGEFANYSTAVTCAVESIKTGTDNTATLVIEENHLRLVPQPDQ